VATPAKTLQQRMGIVALTWPIFIETLLQSLLGISDIFMLSHYSYNAVAAKIMVRGEPNRRLILVSPAWP